MRMMNIGRGVLFGGIDFAQLEIVKCEVKTSFKLLGVILLITNFIHALVKCDEIK